MTTIDYNYTILSVDAQNNSFTVQISCAEFPSNLDGLPTFALDYSLLTTVVDSEDGLTDDIIRERIHNKIFPAIASIIQQHLSTKESQIKTSIETYLQNNINVPMSGYIIKSF